MELSRLPDPEIVSCYFEEGFEPHLPAMRLDWRSDPAALHHRLWLLPAGMTITGAAPSCFGIEVERQAGDTYSVRMVWERTCLGWSALGRRDILHSCLPSLLEAMGTNIEYLLDQPIAPAGGKPALKAG